MFIPHISVCSLYRCLILVSYQCVYQGSPGLLSCGIRQTPPRHPSSFGALPGGMGRMGVGRRQAFVAKLFVRVVGSTSAALHGCGCARVGVWSDWTTHRAEAQRKYAQHAVEGTTPQTIPNISVSALIRTGLFGTPKALRCKLLEAFIYLPQRLARSPLTRFRFAIGFL